MSDPDSTHAEKPRRGFETTQWSLVLAAGHGPKSRRGHDALAELCRRYWNPLFEFTRRRVGDVHRAQDLTQSFVVRLLEKNVVAQADPSRGRFRSFLLTALKNFLANEHNKDRAAKRGGGAALYSLDGEGDERRHRTDPVDDYTPERAFERQWAITLLEQVLQTMRREYEQGGKSDVFEALKIYLPCSEGIVNYSTAAQVLNSTPGAVKVTIHRMRRRYRELLKSEIAQTLADPKEVDDEMRALWAAVRP